MELYREHYTDFGPALAQEALYDREGIKISVSALRRALAAAGVWKPKKSGSVYRSRRTPRSHFGELAQFDGSHHDWFEGRGASCCLIMMIDDAAKIRLSQFFIEIIAANSPQAKGRAERNRSIDQDRLVKALRLEGIRAIEQTNRFLLETYLPKMNKQFSRPAHSGDDAHVNPGKINIDDILCMEFDRCISKDFIIRFQARLFQIEKANKPLPRTADKAVVRVQLDKSVHILWKDKPLLVKEIPALFDE